nr:maternal protein tudor-like isoform X2 [Biomphalaria glabrata]
MTDEYVQSDGTLQKVSKWRPVNKEGSFNDLVRVVQSQSNLEDSLDVSPICSNSKPAGGLNMEDYPIDSINQDVSEIVYTTHTTGLGQFFVHIDSQSYILDDIMEKLANRYMELSPSDKVLPIKKPGTLCAAKFIEDNNWYRAKITGVIKNDLIEVNFVDYGNVDYVSEDCLKALDPDLMLYPVRSYKCVLKGVSANQSFWTPEVMVQFEDLVLDKRCRAVFRGKKDDDTYLIDMYDEEDNSINKLFGAANEVSGFTQISKKVGDKLQGTVVYCKSPNLFWCQESESVNDVIILSEELSRLHMTQDMRPLHNCVPGMICAAKFSEDEAWYRGIIKSVSGRVAEVTFVDYGNTEKVDLDSITNLKPELMRLPALAIKCCLANTEVIEWPHQLLDQFESLVMDKEFEMTIVGTKNDMYEVKLLDIIENTDVGGQLKLFVEKLKGKPDKVSKSVPLKESDLKPITVGSKFEVFLSWIESPWQFYVQRVDSQHILDDLSNKLQQHYSKPQPSATPTPGTIVVARFSEDQIWYRGIVLKELENGSAHVLFIDYGNSDVLPAEDLRLVTPSFGEIFPLAIRCSLWGVKSLRKGDQSCNTDAKDLLEQLTENGALCEVMSETNTHKHVRLVAGNKDVAKELIALRVVGDAHDSVPTQSPSYSNKSHLSKGQKELVTISHVDSVKSFWCLLVKFSDALNNLMDKLSLHYSDGGGTPLREPKVGQACISLYSEDNNWYRGELTQVSQNGCEVFFVDYGNKEISAPNIVCVPEPKFLDLPTQAIQCSLPLSGDLTRLVDAFSDLVLDKELQLEVLDVVNDVAIVELYDGDHPLSKVIQNMAYQNVQGNKSPEPNPPLLTEIMPPNSLPLNSPVKMFASFSTSPSKFYLQTAESESKLASLMDRITKVYVSDNPPAKVTKPQAGHFCMALYPEDDQWYRGKILSVSANSCNVFFLDYGNEAVIDLQNIRYMLPDIAKVPIMAFECSLSDIEDTKWSSVAIDYFESLIMDQELECIFMTPTCVKLKSNGEDVVSLLVKAGHCKTNSFSNNNKSEQIMSKSNNSGFGRFAENKSDNSGFGYSGNRSTNERKFDSGPRDEPRSFGSGRYSDKSRNNDRGDDRLPPRGSKRSSDSSSDKDSDRGSCGGFERSNSRRQGSEGGDRRHDSGFRQNKNSAAVSAELTYPTPPTETETAILVHMDDDGTFYLQLPSMERDIVFLSKKLASSYKTGGPRLRDEAKVGTICCSKFSGDGCMYRSQVEELRGNKVLVRYFDYGNCSECSIQDLKYLFPDFFLLPVLAFPCQLRGLEFSSDKIEKFLEATLDKDIMVTFTSFTRPYQVDIKTPSGDLLTLLSGHSAPAAKLSPKPAGFGSIQNSNSKPIVGQVSTFPKQEFLKQSCLHGSYTAFITHITDGGFFYLQLEKDSTVLETITDTLANMDRNSKHPNIQPGASCGALFSEDSNWYRALVVGKTDGKIQVHFVDYGNGDSVNASDVIPLSSDLLAFPPLAYKCQFQEPLNSDSQTKLADYLMEHLITAEFISGIDPAIVKVFTSDGQDIEEILCPSTNFRSQLIPLEIVPASVSHIEENGRIFLQLYKDQSAISELQKNLSNLYNNDNLLSPETYEVGMPCCALDEDKKWHRACVKLIEDEFVSVLLVDSGKVISVEKNSLKKLEPQFLQKPPYALECWLNGVENWTGDLKAKLASITDNKILNASFHSSTLPYRVSLTRSIELDLLGLPAPISPSPIKSSTTEQTTSSPSKEDLSKSSSEPSKENQIDVSSVISSTMLGDDNMTVKMVTTPLNLEVGQRVAVTVSFVESPDKFYIHLDDTRIGLDELMNEMFEYFTNQSEDDQTVNNLKVEQLCAALYTDESWYRARIKSQLDDGTYQIFYVDHGNSEIAEVSTLRTLPDQFKEHPAWAIEGKLGGVVPLSETWTEEAVEEFKNMVEEKSLLADIISIENSVCVVHLLELGIPVHEVLVKKGYATLCNESMVSKAVQQVFCDANDSTMSSCLESTHVEGDEKTAQQTMMTTGAHAQQKISCISNTLEDQQEVSAFVSYSTNPSCFWCQLSNSSDILSEISASLASLYFAPQDEDIIHGSLNTGDIVVALFTEDSQYYRAEVINSYSIEETETVPSEKVLVRFIDYGNTNETSRDQVFKIREELCQFPAQAFCCSLNQIKSCDDAWSDEACSKFSDLVEDKELRLKCIGRNKSGTLLVELTYPDTEESLASLLAAEGFGRLMEGEAQIDLADSRSDTKMSENISMNPIMESTVMAGDMVQSNLDSYTIEEPENGHYRHLRLTQLTEYDVTVTQDELPSSFFVQLEQLKNQYSFLMADIAEHIVSDSSQNDGDFVPEVGNCCLVQHCGIWYRGEIIKQDNVLWTVQSVDLGWEVNVEENDLKPLPCQFRSLPSQAVPCYLAGIVSVNAEWSSDAIAFFKESIANRKLNMNVLEHGEDGKYGVYLYDLDDTSVQSVNRAMVDMGFADVVPGSNIEVDIQMEKTLDTEMIDQLEESFNEVSILKCNDDGKTEEEQAVYGKGLSSSQRGNVDYNDNESHFLRDVDSLEVQPEDLSVTLANNEPKDAQIEGDSERINSILNKEDNEEKVLSDFDPVGLLRLMAQVKQHWGNITDDMENLRERIGEMTSVPLSLMTKIIIMFDSIKSDILFANYQVGELDAALYVRSHHDPPSSSDEDDDDDDDDDDDNDDDNDFFFGSRSDSNDDVHSSDRKESEDSGDGEKSIVASDKMDSVVQSICPDVADVQTGASEAIEGEVKNKSEVEEESLHSIETLQPLIAQDIASIDQDCLKEASAEHYGTADSDIAQAMISPSKDEAYRAIRQDLPASEETVESNLGQGEQASSVNESYVDSSYLEESSNYDTSSLVFTEATSFDQSNDTSMSYVVAEASGSTSVFNASTTTGSIVETSLAASDTSTVGSVMSSEVSQMNVSVAGASLLSPPVAGPSHSSQPARRPDYISPLDDISSDSNATYSYETSSSAYNETSPSSLDSIPNGHHPDDYGENGDLQNENLHIEIGSSTEATDSSEIENGSHAEAAYDSILEIENGSSAEAANYSVLEIGNGSSAEATNSASQHAQDDKRLSEIFGADYDADVSQAEEAASDSQRSTSESDLSVLTDSPRSKDPEERTNPVSKEETVEIHLNLQEAKKTEIDFTVLSPCQKNDELSDDSGPPSFHEDTVETPRVMGVTVEQPDIDRPSEDVEDFYKLDLGMDDAEAASEVAASEELSSLLTMLPSAAGDEMPGNKVIISLDEVTPDAEELTPDAEKVTPVTEEVTPATVEATPATVEATPATVEATPATVEVTPATMEVTPATMEVTPATVEVTPATVEVTPATVEVTPATVEVTPATVEVTPATVEATPATVEATPATVEATPVTEETSKTDIINAINETSSNELSGTDTDVYLPSDALESTQIQECDTDKQLSNQGDGDKSGSDPALLVPGPSVVTEVIPGAGDNNLKASPESQIAGEEESCN